MSGTSLSRDPTFRLVTRFAPPVMHDYSAFGGTLRSELHFPELPHATGAVADWTLRVEASGAPAPAIAALGERRVGNETYRLATIAGGVRLEYSHAGAFDITANGSRITWYPSADPQRELARAIVIGPALALALEMAGCFCLHGSAVAFGERGVGFLAPKHHGKSTLAIALAAAGARFIGDDTLAVMPGSPAMVRPGVASVRLWDDAARAVAIDRLCETVTGGVKTTASGFASDAVLRAPVALAAIYVLDPILPSESAAPATRARLDPTAAAIALAHHTKLPDSLVGLRAAGLRLRSAVAIAGNVPVYTLTIARSFDLLPAVVAQINAWHREPVMPDAARP